MNGPLADLLSEPLGLVCVLARGFVLLEVGINYEGLVARGRAFIERRKRDRRR